jgi:hypothetical protein
MKKKIIRLKINAYADREKIIPALANSGYKVWVEKEDTILFSNDYFICFELKD